MGEIFLSKTIPKEDWQQTPPPDGWNDVDCYRIETDSGLGIYMADGRKKDNSGKRDRNVTIILPPWSDGTYHNPISQARTKATAATEHSLAMYVDNPGVELEVPPMKKDIRRALYRGDFKRSATQQWDAIEQALDSAGLGFEAVARVMGASLGAHIAAAISRTAPGEVYLNRLDLLETPGLNKEYKGAIGFLRFVGNFLHHYDDQCPEILQSNPC